MRDVDIPNWLKELPLAPVFYPTDTEFADPIAYISKIEKEASAFGICKVVPPLPKPSKKYVIGNLNRSLLKCPELGNDVKVNSVEKVNDGEVRAVFTTRHQELGHSSGKRTKEVGVGTSQPPPPVVNKQVWQSGEIYTLEQFESKSKNFARSQLGMIKEVSPLAVETLFWKAACEKPIYIEYANDVPGSGFGEPVGSSRFVHRHGRRRRRTFSRNNEDCSAIREQLNDKSNSCDDQKGESIRCSPSSSVDTLKKDTSSLNMLSDRVPRQRGSDAGHEIEGTSGWKLSNCPWNLQVIARSPGSLTRFMPDDIPGVTSPMVYIGMLFSWFAWHVEDHELHSLNFLHIGSPKTWYAVPGDYALTFEEVIRSKAYGGGIDRLAALTLLGEKTTLLSPEIVVASGIPCCRLVQNPGEFVVTFPRAYHIGFSHGFNCGEAANFGTPKWLAVAKEAAVRRAAMNFLPMLSHQQLLYLLTMSFIPRVPRSLLPGVRSSRLKDRQKEERELLVKKEFIDDILKENRLLTCILRKSSSYRAVVWDPESLSPSVIKESDLTNIGMDRTINPPTENVNAENGNNLDMFSQMRQDTETLLHIEDEDMSSDFQIDSGTLPCVVCGVLGYPFMSVIQPSAKVVVDDMPVKDHGVLQDLGVENSVSGGLCDNRKSSKDTICFHHPSIASSELVNVQDRCLKDSTYSSKVNIEGWNTSSGYLRPRIFCLEHASKIEELLDSIGGAKLLIICHSDFRKIKAQASVIAEQIGGTFRYNEVQLDDATQDDLHLINLAIDNDQEDESVEDWTLKLNVNLRQSVKLRPKLSPDKIHHALTMNALFADTTPTSSVVSCAMLLQWQATKSRSNRKLNCSLKKSSKGISVGKDAELKEKSSEPQMPKKEGRLIQYSRRSFKSKRQDSATNLSKNTNEDPFLVLGDLSTPEKPDKQHEKQVVLEDSILSQAVMEVSATPVVEDAKTYTSMEMEGGYEEQHDKCSRENSPGSVSCATTIENTGIEKNDRSAEETGMQNETSFVVTKSDSGDRSSSEDGLMQEGSELAKPDESSADEPVTTSKVRVKKGPITDRNEENSPFSSCHTSTSGSKRKREVELLQREEQSDFDGFIRSPCERLRPRGGKDAHKGGFSITPKTITEKPTNKAKASNVAEKPAKKAKASSVTEKPAKKSKASDVKIPEKDKQGSHRCDHEGCKLSFQTKTELSMHRKNRCPHEGCGKKFSSHRYAVLHLRVHEDNRPLKCTWKGCKMTFKWAWARTEHLRVHTGERPYKCTVEGCERTFRFVSDYSRHRRKTGHNVHVKA
ncbi:probable lysine-specific demethylase ELF6 isoform X2 [Cynara cardunculus var. scolymus]|uniref:probable lysine-specific demethylase ELF6 isoform X2 n=1 Tax=Cynara cardunculus var. scolymus TaxID=59895 RepID=UPI000D62CB8C|nr:probable lysine-specific demethylase ELF6 isoform X2 [Cynara cardunculus var. scolymus]